jgi:hypothetical protein
MVGIGIYFVRLVKKVDTTDEKCDGLRMQPNYWGAYEDGKYLQSTEHGECSMTAQEIIKTL